MTLTYSPPWPVSLHCETSLALTSEAAGSGWTLAVEAAEPAEPKELLGISAY